MSDTRAIMVIQTRCTDPTREGEFNEWYNTVHLPDVLNVPGIIRASRFARVVEPDSGPNSFLAIYELDTTDVVAVRAGLAEGAWRKDPSRMFDGFEVSIRDFYTLITRQAKVASAV